jgi:hypothetical protein
MRLALIAHLAAGGTGLSSEARRAAEIVAAEQAKSATSAAAS